MTDTTTDTLRQKLEREQDIRLNGGEAVKPTEVVIDNIIRDGAKVSKIKDAFKKEEDDKRDVERRADDNLIAYLEEREKRTLAEKEVRSLRKQLEEKDRARAEAIEQISRDRDEAYNHSQADKELQQLSRENFKNLLESRKTFKISKQ